VLERLQQNPETQVLALVRNKYARLPTQGVFVHLATLEESLEGVPLESVDAVIHCAARVHVMHDQSSDPLAEFRKVNVDGTLNLARQAAAAGVRRFIFISSIKVNGEGTPAGGLTLPMPRRRLLTRTAFPRWRPSRGCVPLRPKPGWRW